MSGITLFRSYWLIVIHSGSSSLLPKRRDTDLSQSAGNGIRAASFYVPDRWCWHYSKKLYNSKKQVNLRVAESELLSNLKITLFLVGVGDCVWFYNE